VQNQLPDEDTTLVQHDVMQTCISIEQCHSTPRHILYNWNHQHPCKNCKSPTYHTFQWSIGYMKITSSFQK